MATPAVKSNHVAVNNQSACNTYALPLKRIEAPRSHPPADSRGASPMGRNAGVPTPRKVLDNVQNSFWFREQMARGSEGRPRLLQRAITIMPTRAKAHARAKAIKAELTSRNLARRRSTIAR